MNSILLIGILLITGFLLGELAQLIRLPKVTGYIIAGILLNPDLFSLFSRDFTQHTETVTDIALSFIAFSIGLSLAAEKVKKIGAEITWVAVLQSEITFLVVFLAFLPGAYFLMDGNGTWKTLFIPVSLLMAALATPTDPSPILAVEHQNKSKGKLSSVLLGIAAIDDVLAILNFSLAVVIAAALITKDSFTASSILDPVINIVGAAALGGFLGFLFNWIANLIKREGEGVLIVLVFAFLSICYGLAGLAGVEEILSVMVMGVIVANFSKQHKAIIALLQRYTEEIVFVLFFTLSGMHLEFSVITTSFWLILIYIAARSLGKIGGGYLGEIIADADNKLSFYLGASLIPQGGVVIGLALLIKQNPAFDTFSDFIISVTIGATIFHELIGPILTRSALRKAGDIKIKKTSS